MCANDGVAYQLTEMVYGDECEEWFVYDVDVGWVFAANRSSTELGVCFDRTQGIDKPRRGVDTSLDRIIFHGLLPPSPPYQNMTCQLLTLINSSACTSPRPSPRHQPILLHHQHLLALLRTPTDNLSHQHTVQ